MHSRNRSTPDPGARILGTTLARVRNRRTARHRSLGATAALLFVTATAVWTILSRHDVGREMVPNIATRKVPSADSVVAIERIDERPLQLIERLTSSNSLTIQRIPGGTISRIPSLSDDQLLAAIPSDQAAGVVRNADGIAHLVIFP